MTSALGQTYRLSKSARPASDTNPAPDSGIEWVFESVPSFSATVPVASPEPVSDRTGASSPRLRLLAWRGTSEAPDAEFVLRGKLGAGGMGTVYEARQTSLGRIGRAKDAATRVRPGTGRRHGLPPRSRRHRRSRPS